MTQKDLTGRFARPCEVCPFQHSTYQAGSGAISSWCILAPDEWCWWSRFKCQPPHAWQRHQSQRIPCGKRVSVVSATPASIPRRGHIVEFVSDCMISFQRPPDSDSTQTPSRINSSRAIPHESSKRYGQLSKSATRNQEQGTSPKKPIQPPVSFTAFVRYDIMSAPHVF